MNILLSILFALVMFTGNAFGQDATRTYSDVMRSCGAEWRASDTRKATPKGEGTAAWNAFRKDCVARSGYVLKRNRTAAPVTSN